MRVRVGWSAGGAVNSYALLLLSTKLIAIRVGWRACLYIRWRVIILASIDVTSGKRRMVRLQVVYLERTIDVCFSIVLVVLSIVLY